MNKQIKPEQIYECSKSLFNTMFLGGDPTGGYSQFSQSGAEL